MTEMLRKGNAIKLNRATVAVIGIGSVGGYVCEMLARAGVGSITVVDYDIVDRSHLGKQLVATYSTIGQSKVAVIKKRILDINPGCVVTEYNLKFKESSANLVLSGHVDYVIDTMDIITTKAFLARFCKDKGIPVISAIAPTIKCQIPFFDVIDISKSKEELAQTMVAKLKAVGVTKHEIVCNTRKITSCDGEVLANAVYYPVMCAGVITAYVVKKLFNSGIENKK